MVFGAAYQNFASGASSQTENNEVSRTNSSPKEIFFKIEKICDREKDLDGVRKSAASELREIEEIRELDELFLINEFKDSKKDWKYRYSVLFFLQKFAQKNAVLVAREALKESNKNIKLLAISILGNTKDSFSTPRILDFLNDPDGDIRSASALCLGKIGDKASSKHLVRALNNEQQYIARINILKSLSIIKDENTVDDIIHILNNDPSIEVRGLAAITLGHISNSKCFNALIKSINDDNDLVQMNSIIALGHTKNVAALKHLEKFLADNDKSILAIISISKIDGPESSQIIRGVVGDNNYSLKLRELAQKLLKEKVK